MSRALRWYDYITANIYFLGLSTLAQILSSLAFPLLVQHFVGEQSKGEAFGTLRLWTLMAALLAQAFWGILSDRTTSRWGRRRPYIFGSTIVDLVFLVAIGFTSGLDGWSGFWVLFAVALLLQLSSNAGQAAQQGLIPDLVPDDQRGRFSAVKAVFEVPLPLLISFVVGRIVGSGNLVGGILIGAGVLLLSGLLTMLVPESPLRAALPALDWKPFGRLVLMTALFTAIILGLGQAIKLLTGSLNELDINTVLLVLGVAGVAAMGIAIALGVWACVRISIGQAEARRHPAFTWWVVNRLAFLAAIVNISTFALYFVQGRLGLPGNAAAGPTTTLLLVVGLLILFTALASGWLSDRLGHRRVVAIAGITAGVGTLIAILLPGLNSIYLGGVVLGAGAGMFYTANWALGTDIVPKGEAGRYLGLSNLAGAGAGAVGAYIGGPMADYVTARVPDSPGLGYVLLFGIFALLFLGSVVALLGVRTVAPAKTGDASYAAADGLRN